MPLLQRFSHYLCVYKSELLRSLSTKVIHRQRIRTKMDVNLKCRENPVVLKLDSPMFKNIFTQEVNNLKELFDKYQYEIRIAGGAVRDLLMGKQPKDLDFATVATPTEMKEMFTQESIRMINESGEKHGTITARINDKENFEITTLRIDLVTDGRHAEIQFTTDWKLDANRRDLTVNSMFLGFDGSVYDYFFGYEDIQKKRVAFVGDPDVRIKEDYLRILRYFRFYGRIATGPDGHDSETLEVIKRNISGLEIITGERIWMELKKILQGNFACELLKCMIDVGLGPYMGLPSEPNVEQLDKLDSRAQHLNLHPMSLLAALLNDLDDIKLIHGRLKFSNYDRDLLCFIVEFRNEFLTEKLLKNYEKLVWNSRYKTKDTIEYVQELLKYQGEGDLLEQFTKWEMPRFPVSGNVLIKNGIPPGKRHGPILKKLKAIWIDNNYVQSVEELAKLIPEVAEDVDSSKEKTCLS